MLVFWQFHLLGDFPVQLACSLSGGLGSGLYLAFWAETGLRFHFSFLFLCLRMLIATSSGISHRVHVLW